MREITAVLPVRNCRQQLWKCLKALCAGTVVPEIIVVDDGSEDGTAEMVKKYWPSAAYLSLSGHTGYAHAANAGLRLVRSEYAFLIRPDLCPGRSCIEKLLEAMRPDKGTEKNPEKNLKKDPEKSPEKNPAKKTERNPGINPEMNPEKGPEKGSGKAGHDENAGNDGSSGNVFCAVPLFLRAEKRKISEAVAEEENPSKRGAAFSGRFTEKARETAAERRSGFAGKVRETAAERRGGFAGKAREIIAVRDGCAMYSMKALEEIGWFDERHFDGLEAFDLSLRGALYGYCTVEVPGAAVRPFAVRDSGNAEGSEENWKDDTFHRQLTAGNGRYVFYKNLPLAQRLLGLPLYALADLAQAGSFAGHGELDEYRMALTRGRALCSLEKERRSALDEGVCVYPENMSDACFLGMSREAERIYPLFLAEKELFSPGRLLRYLHIQNLLAGDLRGLVRLMR